MTEQKNRCVVTGLGAVSAIGGSTAECWESILAARSGIEHTHTIDTTGCYADYAAEVKIPLAETDENGEPLDRATALCLRATGEALRDAGLGDFGGDRRVSVIIGSCVGGVRSIEQYYTAGKDPQNIPRMPISAIACHVAASCHAGGTVTNVANACAAGTISIAYAADLIRAGRADVVIAGGADAFAAVPYSGFLSLHALDEQSCSPFNRSHGITLGEGAGALIIESYEHAVRRGAHIYCELLGAGISSDAHHITAPRPDGEGQMNAIRRAIAHSGLRAADIDYVNAHGTGTAKNDEAEFLSLHTIFDGENKHLSVSSTKAMTGHCLGAAGALEAVFSVKALTEGTVPPTIGFDEEDLVRLKEKAGDIDFCPNRPRKKELRAVMNNSFAFGGNNASVIFSLDAGNVQLPDSRPDIFVTGLGVVSPIGNGKERLLEALRGDRRIEGGDNRSEVSHEDYDALGLKMAFYRKLDRISQLQAVSGMYALADASCTVRENSAADIGMIVGTSEGALGSSCDFEMLIAERGNAAGSAFKFPNTVYNAAGGYLSICSGIKGYNVTVTNGAQSGLQSVAYAISVMRNGFEGAMLATGTDENNDILSELYHGLGVVADHAAQPYENGRGFALSDGSVSLLLETEPHLAAREGEGDVAPTRYCRVTGYGMAHTSVPLVTTAGSQDALVEAIGAALADASLTPSDIDGVEGFANGCAAVDEIERAALLQVFGGKVPPVLNIKRRTGEGRAASAALSLAHAALLLHGDLADCRDAYRLDAGSVTPTVLPAAGLSRILVIAYGAGGSYTAVIAER